MARVKAVLRRDGTAVVDEQVPPTLQDLTIHPGKREVRISGDAIATTAVEFGVLRYLAQHSGWNIRQEINHGNSGFILLCNKRICFGNVFGNIQL